VINSAKMLRISPAESIWDGAGKKMLLLRECFILPSSKYSHRAI